MFNEAFARRRSPKSRTYFLGVGEGIVSRLLVEAVPFSLDVRDVDLFDPVARFNVLDAQGYGVFCAVRAGHDGPRDGFCKSGFLLLGPARSEL
jgi:hypothetical protein